jgi:phage regulator Rha-like protein
MATNSFIERALAEIASQSKADLISRYNRLERILQQIENVPSPDKEALLVRLITQTPEEKGEEQPHSSL